MTERSTTPIEALELDERPYIEADKPRIPPARPRDKVIAAVTALMKNGTLKNWHSDVEVRRLAEEWLRTEGCKHIPGDGTWKRELPSLRQLWRRSLIEP
jgi:hypothetical protein